ncbi:MAG: outer membrane lipoprotein-sorting protein [Pseudomonadales bacterium]
MVNTIPAVALLVGALLCANAAQARVEPPAIQLDSGTLAAAAAPLAGLAVMAHADQSNWGYQDSTVALTMVLRSASGRENSRELRISQIEVPDDGDRMLVVFDTPRAIRGTALLSYSHPRAVDDQWLYLPALKRVKKINSRNKSGPFLSSEFAFEDLTAQEVEKFSYRYLGTAACALGECYRVERTPLDEFSGYSAQVVAVDTEHLRLVSIEYFDRRGDPLKTLVSSEFQLYQERFWRASRMLMTNHQTGKSTELNWRDFHFSTGLSAERDFSTNALQRAR